MIVNIDANVRDTDFITSTTLQVFAPDGEWVEFKHYDDDGAHAIQIKRSDFHAISYLLRTDNL